jgi:hypothetical protein
MRKSPSLAPPGTFNYDTTVFIVLNDFGTIGSAYCETDEAQADEWVVITDIIDGQYSNPVRIVSFNTHQGWARDVTEEIARKIIDLNLQGTALSAPAREFVGRVTGESARVAV